MCCCLPQCAISYECAPVTVCILPAIPFNSNIFVMLFLLRVLLSNKLVSHSLCVCVLAVCVDILCFMYASWLVCVGSVLYICLICKKNQRISLLSESHCLYAWYDVLFHRFFIGVGERDCHCEPYRLCSIPVWELWCRCIADLQAIFDLINMVRLHWIPRYQWTSAWSIFAWHLTVTKIGKFFGHFQWKVFSAHVIFCIVFLETIALLNTNQPFYFK